MREKKLKPSIMLAALAVTVLAATAIGVYSNTPRDISAATGIIDVLNVGMCTTTDDSVFKESDCDDGDTSGNDYDVAGRDELNEVDRDMFYATYAYDPKTAFDNPRAILQDTDLLKVRITDSGRDRRTGVLVRGAGFEEHTGMTLQRNFRYQIDNTAGSVGDTRELGQLVNEELDDEDVDNVSGFYDDDFFFGKLQPNPTTCTGDDCNLTRNAVIKTSGPIGFGFRRDGSTEFPPMALDGVVKIFGYEIPEEISGSGYTNVQLEGKPERDSAPFPDANLLPSSDNLIKELIGDKIIELDEDRAQGSRNGQGDGDDLAPWLTLNASVQSGKDIVIVAIYYQTSGYEELVGNQKEGGYVLSTNDDPTEYTTAQEVTDSKPVFTDDEMDDDDALVVKVEGDEGDGAVNLYLRETGRFDGVYEGYVRLTDANGRGSEIDNAVQDASDVREDWGYTIRHGKAPTRDTSRDGDPKQKLTKNEAAIVGVDQGPVKITYKDSDGKTRTYNVQIDIAPPTIAVTTPENGSTTSDSSPSFEGTFDDIGAGLAKDSFRLYADNNEDGGGDEDAVLDLAHGVTADDNTAEVRDDYRGYVNPTGDDPSEADIANANADPANRFAVFKKSVIYFGSEDCDKDDNECYIESRRYDDGDSSSRFDEDVRITGPETRNEEVLLDFQALVLDMAGNIGFSDAHEALPTFIGDLGTATNADPKRNKTRDNVIGWYSRHTVLIDDKEPDFNRDRSVTGFYGSDKDGDPIVNKSGIMLVFNDKIDRNSVTTSTFAVELDDGNFGSVQDLDVDSDDPTRVYLLMDTPLKPDATPEISIATGQSVEDLAGNETTSTEADEFEAKDGIAPTFTLSLRDGSGTGTGSEGPDSLTNNTIVVRIASDERIQGAPKLTVVCDDLQWTDIKGTDTTTTDDETKKVKDLVDGLSGTISGNPSPTQDGNDDRQFTCGKPVDEDGDSVDGHRVSQSTAENYYILKEVTANSRAGDAWEYTWRNLTGSSALEPGKLQVIVWGRDRSSFEKHDGNGNLNNWESANTSFTFDNELKSPTTSAGGEVLPADGTEVSEIRPFILLEFSEGTTVTLDSVTIDDNAITMDRLSDGRFVYWPPNLGFGDHTVKVEATDAAGNEKSFEYDFKVVQRKDFVIELLAGWNAISLPADPIDSTLGAVFTNPMIDSVLGWDTTNGGSWRFAVRQDGVWSTSDQFGTLTDVEARYGYWVHSEGFIRQPVQLATIRRGQDTPTPRSIPTNKGWNFVGVVDQDGDQTEDHFNDSLRDSDLNPISAENYLGENFTRAYTWNATFNRFDTLDREGNVQIGQGIWVFYGEGIAP